MSKRTTRKSSRRATVRLGYGERLVLLGHEIAIAVPGDRGDALDVYTSEDWRACGAPTYGFVIGSDETPVLFRYHPEGLYGQEIGFRFARCPSEEKRFVRLFVRTFEDNLRIAA